MTAKGTNRNTHERLTVPDRGELERLEGRALRARAEFHAALAAAFPAGLRVEVNDGWTTWSGRVTGTLGHSVCVLRDGRKLAEALPWRSVRKAFGGYISGDE